MKKPLMTLAARFDVNQVDDGIDWEFSDIDFATNREHASLDQCWNRDIEFWAGQNFRIAVTASDKEQTGFESFEVVDCCLVTRPRIIRCGPGLRTWYAPPSLFVDDSGKQLGAICQIEPSAFTALGDSNEQSANGRRITLLWDGNLNVGPYNGFWELTFYITVSIKRIGEDTAQLRMFYFDPETEVGNGTNPPDPY